MDYEELNREFFRMVKEFYEEMDEPMGVSWQEFVNSGRKEAREEFVEEEYKETRDALKVGDTIETLDGICDILYTAIGYFVEVDRNKEFDNFGQIRFSQSMYNYRDLALNIASDAGFSNKIVYEAM